MGDLTLVLGGARSGKSRHAEALVTAGPAPWTYIATAEAGDDEMAARIAEHRGRRGPGWRTIEAPRDLAGAIEALPPNGSALVDCLTLWLSNAMLAEADLAIESDRLLAALAARRGAIWLVSNEVGFGVVPENALARRFRDAAGLLNQRVAAVADRVDLVAAGLPLRLR